MALNEHDRSGPERDARLDGVYAHAGREEPPAHLDAAIQAAARRAVGARPQPLGARLRRWGVPISIAAVVVVSVSLVTLMREEGVGRLEESYPPAPAEPKAAAPALSGEAQMKARDRAEPAARAQVESPPAPPAAAEPAGAASSEGGSLGSQQLMAPSSAPQKPAEEAANAAPRAPAEAERAAARKAAPGQEVLGKKKVEAPAAEVPREPLAARRSAPLRADQRPMASSSIESRERLLTDDEFRSLLKKLEKAEPDVWLETMERLRREGRHADADALLIEFKKRFPGHPASLQEVDRPR